MIKEKIEKIKENFKVKEGQNNKKTIENLAIFAVLLIITIVAVNYIWSDDKGEVVNDATNKKLAAVEENSKNANNNTSTTSSDIEERLKKILANIKGVGNVEVLITYSQTSQIIPMYDEDSSTTTTEETDSRRRN